MSMLKTNLAKPQSGFISISQLPYLLLALAVLILLFLWNSIRSKNGEIEALQQAKASEVSALEAKLQTSEEAMSSLNTAHLSLQEEHNILKTESIPALKKDLSFANAQVQRATHVSDARDNLKTALATAKETNKQLTSQAQLVPQLKRNLSFANAENQRSQHTNTARENLIAALKASKSENAELAMQLQQSGSQSVQSSNSGTDETNAELETLEIANRHLADRLVDRSIIVTNLKKELSFATAENQRAQNVHAARNNLIQQLKTTKQNQQPLAELAAQLPEVKRELSFANAENQRAKHVRAARDNLIQQLKMTKQNQQPLANLAAQLPDIKKELSMANAENARLQHVSNARDRLIARVKEMGATTSN